MNIVHNEILKDIFPTILKNGNAIPPHRKRRHIKNAYGYCEKSMNLRRLERRNESYQQE